MNQLTFITESNIIHNNKYDYSSVEYKNKSTKVKIICPVHGLFEQLPKSHLNGNGCRNCANSARSMTTEKCIEKIKSVQKDSISYDKVIYKNSYTPIIITCPIHGDVSCRVETAISTGCKKCNDIKRGSSLRKDKEFIHKSNIIHNNKYDYSLVEYKDIHTKIKIICPDHGIFLVTPHHHKQGRGCGECYRNIYTIKEFIHKSNIIHNNKYDYSLVQYINSQQKVKIMCKEHGVFEQRPYSHIQGNGCSMCSLSKGEQRIMTFLKIFNIPFDMEYSFNELVGVKNSPLRFDFYLSDHNICIEYNGIQHYEKISFFDRKYDNKGFEVLQEHDNRKIKYCLDNNIRLITISYTDFQNIEKILKFLI